MDIEKIKKDIKDGLLFGGLFFSVTMYLVPWMKLLFGSTKSPLRSVVNIALSVMLYFILSPLIYFVFWNRRKDRDVVFTKNPSKKYFTKRKLSAYTLLSILLYLPDIVMLQRYFISTNTIKFALFLACLSVSMLFMGFLLHWNYKYMED